MQIARTIEELRNAMPPLKASGRVAFVPTMGALHEGHMSLVEKARLYSDNVVASVFVNPTQFGPNEDFARYPRQEEKDASMLENAGAKLLWMPPVGVMYPEGFATKISVGKLGEVLCGKFRTGHFDGVATVVAKLFIQVQPDFAIFGEKDFQQLTVIKRMVRDLNLEVEVIGAETVREADGLALSSRNSYLSAGERKIAAILFKVLNETKEQLAKQPIKNLIESGTQKIIAAGFSSVDYLAICNGNTLEEISSYSPEIPTRILVAARLGKTRLIDNIKV